MKDLNFLKRIYSPSKFPYITNKDGSTDTHLMSYAKDNDMFLAFPRIIQKNSGSLEKLGLAQALQHALLTKEFLNFNSEDEAKEYAGGGGR